MTFILPKKQLKDGLYQVTTQYLCAGFVVVNGLVRECAPILSKQMLRYMPIAKRIGD